jgi:RNA-directed DNA polymerase
MTGNSSRDRRCATAQIWSRKTGLVAVCRCLFRNSVTMPSPSFYSSLARSILAAEPSVEAVSDRVRATVDPDPTGKDWRWIRGLASRYVQKFAKQTRPRRRDVIEFLHADEGLRDAASRYQGQLRIARWIADPARMQPAQAARTWPVPPIATVGELAAWLGVSAGQLEWFADLKRLSARQGEVDGPMSHYHYRVLAKPGGAIRLIEAPKKRLKELQRVILAEIVEKMPAHAAAHGFLNGHSIKTHAALHVGRQVVLRMDLRDFFPSISAPRVRALFRTAGYPDAVADLLGGLCTNAAPRKLLTTLSKGFDPLAVAEARALYACPHLPQGAPTSPALANLIAYRVDCRLTGLARSAGALYTRYADDLAFSGDAAFRRCLERFPIQAAAIVREEGFEVHHRKTRVMRRGVRQLLAGVVVNQRINGVRTDFDRLKAILTNCVRHGAESQNREAHASFRSHLLGRIGFVAMLNPAKGLRLRRVFDQIQWP